MSLAGLILSIGPVAISGAMYAGVPPIEAMSVMLRDLRKPFSGWASPQSMTRTSPNSPSMMFSGLRSRCTMPRACAKPIASAVRIRMSRFSASVFFAMTLFQGVPWTFFME